jgi:A/G-specific adenine glycosylase
VASTPIKIEEITRLIETWFKKNARSLPWRIESTAWGRLVSEFMAQQTQISRVAERWPLLMERFPTPESMAISSEQEVLSLWQGLGYYRRAKHLKQTAETITQEFNGSVPCEVESLLSLSGVGKYNAGAIASIVFGKRVPIVDGNVHRVLCRVYNYMDNHTTSEWTWRQAEAHVNVCANPSVFNEGLMEFGATVCTPKVPSCEQCPLQNKCLAFKNGTQLEIPIAKKRTIKQQRYHYSVVMCHKDELAFEKRSDSGLWAGMWQVPTIESSKKLTRANIAKQLQLPDGIQKLGKFEHVLTHRVISFTVFSCNTDRESRFSWLNHGDIEDLPLASAQRKVLAVHCMA